MKKKILIIGISGGLAQISARMILEHHPNYEVIGVDSRPIHKVKPQEGLSIERIRYTRGQFENIFRKYRFDCVIHLARVSHSSNSQKDLIKRLDLNVIGTNTVLDLCLHTEVKKVIILSTFHVYGALSDNPVYLSEKSPLRASLRYPELRDVVDMDQICTNWMWHYQNQIETVVLRPTNIIGGQIQNAMTKFLTHPLAIRPIDYNPMFQFIHEFDMARVLMKSLSQIPTGVYNVASSEFIELGEALKLIHKRGGLPFSITLAKGMNRLFSFVPRYLVDYLKFSCLLDNREITKYLGDDFFQYNLRSSLRQLSIY